MTAKKNNLKTTTTTVITTLTKIKYKIIKHNKNNKKNS